MRGSRAARGAPDGRHADPGRRRRLTLALPAPVAIRVDRAVSRGVSAERCPARDPDRRYRGELRRVATLQNVATAASVQRRLTRSFALAPGLYRISVRAHRPGGGLTGAAYRWVRVLAG